MSFEMLEEFLSERHDLCARTKLNYRMAFQALSKYVTDPFALDQRELDEALNKLSKDYAESSWNTYVMCVRAAYVWMGKAEVVKHIKFKRIRREDYIKTKILKDSEIKAMLRATDNPRDRAFIAVLAATGARRGEMLGLRIRDVEWRPYGYDLVLTGKTGTHPSPPIFKDYAKILRVWLEHHPARNNPDAPLWVRMKGTGFVGIKRVQAHNIVKKAARRAEINRNVHLHMFRHTENTLATKRHIPSDSLKKLHGWSKDSAMPNIYSHLTDQDSVNSYLRGYGVLKVEEATDSFEPVECGYCHEVNASENQFCCFCGLPLSDEAAEKLIEREKRRDGLQKRVEDLENAMRDAHLLREK